MKKMLKILLYSLVTLIGLIVLIVGITIMWISVSAGHSAKKNIALAGPEVKTLTVDGFTLRDLNKNSKLNVYEDIKQPTGPGEWKKPVRRNGC